MPDWGANPVWASLVQDYLSIMSSSVSSEHTFLHGRITISKWQSCLKGDLIEALQCVKCAIWNDLLFQDTAPSSALETELKARDNLEGDKEDVKESKMGQENWDQLLIDNKPMSDVDFDSE